MNKQTEALKMLFDAVDKYRWAVGSDAIQSAWQNVCDLLDVEVVKALEQPTVAELNDEYLRDTNVAGLEQQLTRDWKETIDERIAKDDEFKKALEQPTEYLYVYKGSEIWLKDSLDIPSAGFLIGKIRLEK